MIGCEGNDGFVEVPKEGHFLVLCDVAACIPQGDEPPPPSLAGCGPAGDAENLQRAPPPRPGIYGERQSVPTFPQTCLVVSF